MAGERPRRVAEQIQRLLSSRLIPALRDPRLGFATVTAVDVSRDLRSARVYITFLDLDALKKKDALIALNGASGHFRREMGREMRLRFMPSLRFEEDASVQRAGRIEQIIREIRASDGDAKEEEQEEEE